MVVLNILGSCDLEGGLVVGYVVVGNGIVVAHGSESHNVVGYYMEVHDVVGYHMMVRILVGDRCWEFRHIDDSMDYDMENNDGSVDTQMPNY